MLNDAGKHYEESIIKEYSIKLTNELHIKHSVRSLYKNFNYLCKSIK